MKTKLLFAASLLAVLFAACEPTYIEVEKIVEVPVEVSNSDMPDSLRAFLDNDQLNYTFNSSLSSYSGYPNTITIVSYGRNQPYKNAITEQLPQNIILSMIYDVTYDEQGKQSLTIYRVEGFYVDKNGGFSDSHSMFNTTDDSRVLNDKFFDENQYVYKIIHGAQ